jgi:hypothetical protein
MRPLETQLLVNATTVLNLSDPSATLTPDKEDLVRSIAKSQSSITRSFLVPEWLRL